MTAPLRYVEKLLAGADVEWKPSREIFHLKNGYTPSKSNREYWENGVIPWFRMEDIRENGRILHDAIQKVSITALKGGKPFPKDSIIIATSATIGEHALIRVPYLSNQRFTNLILKTSYKNIFDIKFLFYYAFLIDEWCCNNVKKSSFASVDMVGFKKNPIPLPPLHAQHKIVGILDKFTDLAAELTAELNYRKKQYKYFCDKLLHFGSDVEWKTLEEIICPTNNIKWKDNKNKYKYIDLTSVDISSRKINSFSKISQNTAPSRAQKIVKKEDIIFATTRPTQQRFCIIPEKFDNSIASSGYCVLRANTDHVLPKWIFYMVSTDKFKNFLTEREAGTAYPAISDSNLKKFPIPVPPLAEQERIVAILDRFDTMVHSITEGLPREIELRRKQYEYYRDRLLTFPKPE